MGLVFFYLHTKTIKISREHVGYTDPMGIRF